MEWVALILVAIVWRSLASRTKAVRKEMAELRAATAYQEQVIQSLTRRVFELEHGGRMGEPHVERPPEAVERTPEEVFAMPPMVPPVEPRVAEPVSIDAAEQRILDEEILAPPPVAVAEPVVTGPSMAEELRERMKGVDWEALIGGSWLNALGVLILVVGVALFLGYALTQFGPAGKVSIGVGVGLAMLGAGVWVERKERYAVFGRGLLAGGWAALYSTVYAAHALPAARMIESEAVGGALLLMVACGMIGHSLRYRSQNLTLLAYFTAYVALQIGPLTWLSIAATVPLAVSLLTVSRALGWNVVPVVGIVLTYFTFAFRYRPEELAPLFGAAALYSYWVAFEVHDLMHLRAGRVRGGAEVSLFPLNALMLLGTAMLSLPPSDPLQSANFFGTAGTVFLISTILRKRWPAVVDEKAMPVVRVLSQSYRMAISLSAALFAAALMKRFSVPRSQIGLLLEAQLLVLAGVRGGDRFFSHVGAAVFGFAVVAMFGRDDGFGTMVVEGRKVAGWLPFPFAMAVLYGVNRWLTRAGAYYTWGALGLLMIGCGELLRDARTGVAWVGLGVLAVELFRRTGWKEFFYQAAVAGGMGFVGLALSGEWKPLAAGALLLAWIAWRDERLREGGCALAGAAAALAAWYALPGPLVAPAWALISMALLEAGSGAQPRIAWQAHALGLMAVGRLYVANFVVVTQTAGLSHRVLTVVPVLFYAWHMWRNASPLMQRVWSWAGVITLGSLVRFELGRTLVVVGWAGLMLLLLHLALVRKDKDQLWQGYALGVLCFARGWATNFNSYDTLLGLPERLVIGVLVIGAFHLAEFRLSREHRFARPGFALMGVALLSILLYYEVSGSLLTIALGAQAVVVLMAGFWAQERVLRLAGLSLFGICILKLFFYDLRTLETLARILSFIVLGLVLMGASWLYMRFKEKIQRYL